MPAQVQSTKFKSYKSNKPAKMIFRNHLRVGGTSAQKLEITNCTLLLQTVESVLRVKSFVCMPF